MSRIGKKPILIPTNVQVEINGDIISVKGPLGNLERVFGHDIKIEKNDNTITLVPTKENQQTKAMWGTYASHLINMIEGVSKGFEKKLVIEGVGFKVQLEGTKIVLNLGFSHPVKVEIPQGIKVEIEKNKITITGSDKEKIGDFTSKIRALKKPEPYKGKGIRYEGEVVRRKAGKKAATAK